MTDETSSAAPTCVTGAAGFIGFHVARRLLELGRSVVGVDNFTPYYDLSLKEARVAALRQHESFRFVRGDLADRAVFDSLVAEHKPDRVIHLAAQPGVRYSLENPRAYVDGECREFHERIGDLQTRAGTAPDLCLVKFRVRVERDHAVFRAGQCGPPG